MSEFVRKIDSLIDLVDELTYRNYRHNRNISPNITVERWEKCYGPNTQAMETRYQQEPPTAGEIFRFENPGVDDEYYGEL